MVNIRPDHRDVRTRDGVNLSVKIFGPQEGRPIIFLHGFPEFWFGWRKQIPYFEEQGYYVVVPDQRGYNDSEKPKKVSEYTLKHLADDVALIVENLGLKKPVLVGHDWGAAAAWQAAINFPELFSKLIVMNVPHPRVMIRNLALNPLQFLKSWYMYFFQIPFLPENLIALLGYERFAEGLKRTSRPGTFSDEDLEHYIEAWSKPNAMRSMINWYRAAFQHPDIGGEARVKVPTLILWGEKDAFLESKMARESVEYCDKAEVQYFPEATHWLHHEEADAVNRAIDKFIS